MMTSAVCSAMGRDVTVNSGVPVEPKGTGEQMSHRFLFRSRQLYVCKRPSRSLLAFGTANAARVDFSRDLVDCRLRCLWHSDLDLAERLENRSIISPAETQDKPERRLTVKLSLRKAVLPFGRFKVLAGFQPPPRLEMKYEPACSVSTESSPPPAAHASITARLTSSLWLPYREALVDLIEDYGAHPTKLDNGIAFAASWLFR